jgi:hypothetical protein
MIESLESFWQGLPNSDGEGKRVFCFFFDRNDAFADFRGHSQDFYKHVRCGILHQAETTGGWRILRKGDLVDHLERTINAKKFRDALETCLINYCEELKRAEWNEAIWKNLRNKMDAIIKNCIRD